MMILVMILAFIIFAGVALIEGALIGGIIYFIAFGIWGSSLTALNFLWLWLAGTLMVLIKPSSAVSDKDTEKFIKEFFNKDKEEDKKD